MHFFDAKKHFYGGHASSADRFRSARSRYAQKYLGTNRVTLAYMGDADQPGRGA